MKLGDLPQTDAVVTAPFLASEYHGGQFTAMYALSSAGSLELYPGEGLGRIIREVKSALEIAGSEYPEDYDTWAEFLQVLTEHENQL